MALLSWLQAFVSAHGGVAGTVHTLENGALELKAAHNIPPPVVAITQRIPFGKGMAGLAWERNQAVSTCNLQTDTSGTVRPGAKAVDAQAALAIPVRDDTGAVRAVVGIAFAGEREFDSEDLARFEALAAELPRND